MKITGKTKVYGILGNPVEHSFSPLIHNYAFKKLKIDATYVPFKVSCLQEALLGLKSMNIQGVSVTIPFKVEIVPFLDKIDPLAKHIGAVNTVVNHDGFLIGYNTDGIGALLALKEKTNLENKTILILGYGGASRAVAFSLALENPKTIYFTGKRKEEAQKLAQEVKEKTGVFCDFWPWDTPLDYQILINTTPLGMSPHQGEIPLKPSLICPKSVVFDMVYNPHKTLLLQEAQHKKCVLVYGSSMLLYQGAKQFLLWTNQEPPIKTMKKALKKALKN